MIATAVQDVHDSVKEGETIVAPLEASRVFPPMVISMVDVGEKSNTKRVAIAIGSVSMTRETLEVILSGNNKKGDVFSVAKIAGIQAAKNCSQLIPLCHPLMLTSVKLDFTIEEDKCKIAIKAECKVNGPTGVEMEALTAVTVAGLTIYDMCKAVDRGMEIGNIRLTHKSGGKSGVYDAE